VVSGVTLSTVRHKISGMVLRFNKPLAGGSAGNTANYSLDLLALGRRPKHGQRQFEVTRTLKLAAAVYDPNAHTVTLTFGSRFRAGQMFQLRVSGGQGGITDASGNPLNSPARGMAGSDYVYSSNPSGS
jgi:hypothetical protein